MIKYKIFCLGGSGNDICKTFLSNNIDIDNIYFFDTDERTVEDCSVKHKFLIGTNTTKGLGCGASIQLATKAFEEDKALFEKLTNDNYLYFIISGFGGGSGTGLSMKLTELLQFKKKLFIMICTLPFKFEGYRRRSNAQLFINEITKLTNEIITIENNDLLKTFSKGDHTTISEAFSISSNFIVEVFKEIIFECKNDRIINESLILNQPGLNNIILQIKLFVTQNNLISTVSSKIIISDTNDELLKALTIDSELIYTISPRRFEEIIEYIYRLSGYETKLTSYTRDGGADVLVWTPPPVLGNRFLTVIQAKRYNKLNKIGAKEIRELLGTQMTFNADKAQIITTSDFSKPAKKTALLHKIDLIQYNELKKVMNTLIK